MTRTDAAAQRRQIEAMADAIGDAERQIVALREAIAQMACDAPFTAAPAAAATSPSMRLTDGQKRLCRRVINVFETGRVEGDYGAISIYHDGPGQILQVTYGRAQTTEFGNLRELVHDYAEAGGLYSDALGRYVPTIGTKVGDPPASPLVGDATFKSLLKKAGADPVMRATQDAFFDRVYLQPALDWGGRNGFTTALSALVIYDSFTHSGSMRDFLVAEVREPTPAKGGDEKAWIKGYVDARYDWLADNARADLRKTVYRMKDMKREIARQNWDLSHKPIMANGVAVDDAPAPVHVAAADAPDDAGVPAFAEFATADTAQNDGAAVPALLNLCGDETSLHAAQRIAARRLLDYDGEIYPHDGCAITLSTLLQQAGIEVENTFLAFELTRTLAARGWSRVAVGQQRRGDVGTTCGTRPRHGADHIYVVLRTVNADEMVIADNQEPAPHFRFASGRGGKTPTTYFLRAPS